MLRLSIINAARLVQKSGATKRLLSTANNTLRQAHNTPSPFASFASAPSPSPLFRNSAATLHNAFKTASLEQQQAMLKSKYGLRFFSQSSHPGQKAQVPSFYSSASRFAGSRGGKIPPSTGRGAAAEGNGLWNNRGGSRRTFCKRSYHDHHGHYYGRRRRPFRFLFRLIAIPAMIVSIPILAAGGMSFGAFVLVPIVLGGALMLGGGLLMFVLPLIAIGGATVFAISSWPAAMTVKDLNEVVKTFKNDRVSALEALGSDFRVEKAGPGEHFYWQFPTKEGELDKVDIRMQAFAPNSMWMRKLQKSQHWRTEKDSDHSIDYLDDGTTVTKSERKWRHRHGHQDDNGTIDFQHKDGFLEIKLEQDGEALMKKKMGKKYLQLGQVVDQAAKEMEARQPGLKLGDQLVLVKTKPLSMAWPFWRESEDVSVRIPFSRNFVRDLTE